MRQVDIAEIKFITTKEGTVSLVFVHRDGREGRPVIVDKRFALGDTVSLRLGVGTGSFSISATLES